ncbi:RNA-binding protein 26 isoform X1 [Apis laboriosa]|uniref:RNA-binding protein 26 n=1 Tax=Apis mellifera TaxID=7460 RepID=A0A7M7LMJ1_APIME|nr:RNA-binding protein 26 [Apis mellifera]XP_006625086.1 RNA-binding protein 26 [Apis dorsata]XP_006625087.1 RNA-binding protein 26 [Apis dorsata]XP_016922427.1 RNA-binding protein 26 [Apis cerana]XP_031775611.1 RNA-binding protein 26 [Apis florea]XP_043788434.1 RNA-binding protein 26 isoform X1 [Apis laboriosa]XP_061939363.1 RNA-binding protein 26 [Apis cerana]XP_393406.4 RNA-binding protein 26 [Apis mellifera]KAG6798124.1 RNA-binding protein [Apis mellifera caucasica]KAG9429829.1 RNA-bin|eukprot:XP_006560861.1 RNA-binding protein 26 [Apis mellifera]
MIIENPDQFKAWLTAVLEPLCDADPAALAKYVYALVKKDKTLEELRGGMVEQLDVFLQQETKNFVELLFKTLETQEYVLPPPKSDPDGGGTPPGINPPPPALNTEKVTESTIPITSMNTNPPAPLQMNGSAPMAIGKRETRKSDSEKVDKEKEKRSRSRSGRMRSRTRSRSRSWERDRRRSRSREHIRRDRERDRSRPWRNESPPNTRRHDRRRSRSRSTSPIRPRIRDGPDNRDHRARFRNRSPTPLRSRSRSRSLERKKIDRSERMEVDRTERIDGSPGGGTPTQDSNHGDVDMRLSTTSQSIQSVVAVASSVPNSQPGFQTKRRCRDFDEKGYCMRGDLCPYDHGTDPVVLEDVALSRVLTFGPHSAQAPGTVPVTAVPEPPPGPNGNAPPQHLPLASLPPPHLRNQHHSNMDAFAEYNPDAPSMEPRMPWGRHPQPGPAIYGRGQRELISVPVIPHTNSSEITHTQTNPLKRKQTFDFNRLGPKQRVVHNPANCSLELKKVPRSLNNITQLNNHFSKFGKIVNIQVNFGGDPEGALVTFQLPAEAKAAYRSTEAVLNNRFIKVFWHNNINNNASGGAIENVPPGCRPSVKERLGAAVTVPAKTEENEYIPTRRSTEEQVSQTLVPTSPKTTTVPTREDKVLAIKKTQEILAAKETLKKKQEEKRKEALKLTADLRKRKQELLDKHLIEIRALIDKAEKNPEQKDAIMATIKTMQQSIDNLRKDLAANGQIGGNKTQIKSREQTQKEILDAELDLMTAQQEGQDAGELQKRLNELRAQAAALGLNAGSAIGRGTRSSRVIRGSHALSYRGRGRGSFAHVSVDHRPTSLLVSGYETEEKAEVLAHFQQFGEIVNQIVDDATPSIVINFKSRKEAEIALVKGRTFQDRLLSITWVSGHHLHRGGGGSNTNASVQLSSRSEQAPPTTDEDIDLEGNAEALLLEENEEEEDEDGESRSWRR